MGLFGFSFSRKNQNEKKDKPLITQNDQSWVDESFSLLLHFYEIPASDTGMIVFSKEFFPNTFSSQKIEARSLVKDISVLLDLKTTNISVEFHKDWSDTYGSPHASFDESTIETERQEDRYILHIENHLLKSSNRLPILVLKEMIKIRLIEDKVSYDEDNDAGLFVYLAGIYFGFGVIFANNLVSGGYSTDGFWESNWSSRSLMPKEVLAFGLALYTKMTKIQDLEWKSQLPLPIKEIFEEALNFVDENTYVVTDSSNVKALNLIRKSYQDEVSEDYNKHTVILKEALQLANDSIIKAEIFNSLGYAELGGHNLEKAIPYFESATELYEDYGYALDNLAFVHTITNDLDRARFYLEKAIATENNHLGYHYRNVGVYYFTKEESDKAEKYFKMALEEQNQNEPVDLLEVYYADLLINQGFKEKAIHLLQGARWKGEKAVEKQITEIAQM